MKVFHADMFIVPNGISSLEREERKWWNGFTERANARLEHMGCQDRIRDTDKVVQIWISGEGTDDWGSHELPFEIQEALGLDEKDRCFFQEMIPVRWVEGLKEGDTFRLYLEGKEEIIAIDIRLNQKDYRYRTYGTFEQVLRQLLEAHDRRLAEKYAA